MNKKAQEKPKKPSRNSQDDSSSTLTKNELPPQLRKEKTSSHQRSSSLSGIKGQQVVSPPPTIPKINPSPLTPTSPLAIKQSERERSLSSITTNIPTTKDRDRSISTLKPVLSTSVPDNNNDLFEQPTSPRKLKSKSGSGTANRSKKDDSVKGTGSSRSRTVKKKIDDTTFSDPNGLSEQNQKNEPTLEILPKRVSSTKSQKKGGSSIRKKNAPESLSASKSVPMHPLSASQDAPSSPRISSPNSTGLSLPHLFPSNHSNTGILVSPRKIRAQVPDDQKIHKSVSGDPEGNYRERPLSPTPPVREPRPKRAAYASIPVELYNSKDSSLIPSEGSESFIISLASPSYTSSQHSSPYQPREVISVVIINPTPPEQFLSHP